MTRDEIETEIRNKLAYNTGLSSSLIVTSINNAQNLLEEGPILPWFLESDYVSLTTTIGDEKVALPTNFIREVEEKALWYYDSTADSPWVELAKNVLEDNRTTFNTANTISGPPKSYSIQGSNIRVFPKPDAVYTLKFIYYKHEDLLTAGSDTNDWSTNFPYLLIGKAGGLLAMDSRDKDGMQIFSAIEAMEMDRLGRAVDARKWANFTMQRGGDD